VKAKPHIRVCLRIVSSSLPLFVVSGSILEASPRDNFVASGVFKCNSEKRQSREKTAEPSLQGVAVPRSVNIVRTRLVLWAFFLAVLHCSSSRASKVEDLRDSEVYYLRTLSFSGNHALSDTELTTQLSVKPRPFYQLWKKRPAFDPEALPSDLKRVRRLYEAHGYYKTTVSYELNIVG
jgi:hypothetical protein